MSQLDPGESGNDPAGLFEQFLELHPDAVVGGAGPVWDLLDDGAGTLAQLLQDACIASLLSDGRWLQRVRVADPDPEVRDELAGLANATLREHRGIARQALSAGKALRLTDPSPPALVSCRPGLAGCLLRIGIRSAILAPMRACGRPVGLVVVFRRRDRPAHTEHDEGLVQVVADWLAAAAGAEAQEHLPSTAAGGGEPRDLTEREQEVLALLALGHTNREIAEQLFLSVRTVEWYRGRLRWKLGVTGRAALTRRARTLGLID